jgi:hypothetical protein
MSGDAILLIDLENMIGSRAKQNMMERKLDALLGHAGAGTPAVAACAGSAITDVGTQLLASRHVKLHKVSGAKDAADKKLREEAASHAGEGCRRFLVASYDSSFGQIADLGRLEIIVWDTANPKLAQKYAQRAAEVHRVPKPTTSAPTSPVQPPEPLPARPGAGSREAVSAPSPQSSAAAADLAPLAAFGLGVIAGGMLIGAGTILGAAVALRLLRAGGLVPERPAGD